MDFNHSPKKKKNLHALTKYMVLNESNATTDYNSSVFMSDPDNFNNIDAIGEAVVDKILVEKLVVLFKTPTKFNWAWQFILEDQGDWV